jgi:hypothetical protein
MLRIVFQKPLYKLESTRIVEPLRVGRQRLQEVLARHLGRWVLLNL